MSPLLLGAAWILFVVSCFASMVPESGQPIQPAWMKPNLKSNLKSKLQSNLNSKRGGHDEETT